MRPSIAGIIVGLFVSACQPAQPSAANAWIRLPAVTGRPAAAYFDLAAGRAPLTLLSVKTPAAIRSELHESMAAGAMTSMKPLAQVDVPANGAVQFAPGGKHVMLFDVAPTLRAGDTAKLTLAFADGKTLETQAKVLAAGDAAPHP